jgi:hypothetical protein
MTTKTTELQGNSRTIFLAIAEDRFARCAVTGPARAAAVGALLKRGLILKQGDGYNLTEAGVGTFEQLRPRKVEGDTKARAERPRHNAKVHGYVCAIRADLGDIVANVSDDAIAEKVWRFGTVEKAITVARSTFHGVEGAV